MSMTERQLSKAVVALAETLGWRVYTVSHTKAAGLRSHTGVGWPDLFLAKDGQALAVELKVKGRRPTEAQLSWLGHLEMVPGILTWVWTEHDWHDGTVEQVLKGGW